MFATNVAAETFTATYEDPTTRYAHGVLGDAVEWGTLTIRDNGKTRRVRLPDDRVFEDLTPRLWNVVGDETPEIVVIETQRDLGAQLAIYDRSGRKLAATPHIGRSNRWLAPIGAADLDGDGRTEIAYIDRPHLAKLLRIWHFEAGGLTLVAERRGFTNHRIGDDFITGGLRKCGARPELIVVSADWADVVSITFVGGILSEEIIGRFEGQFSIDAALNC
ncbi:MAG: VCBS repeat-containing protein [Paracoccaceae bacterium]